MDKAILSIFKLFNEVDDYFDRTNVIESNSECHKIVEEASQKIDEGRSSCIRGSRKTRRMPT